MMQAAFLAVPCGMGVQKVTSRLVPDNNSVSMPRARRWMRSQHGFKANTSMMQGAETVMEQEKKTAKMGRPKNPPPPRPQSLKKTGMNTAVVLSKELEEFAGKDMMRRPELVSKICDYIKENNLYVPGNRKAFRCDDTLRRILKTDGEHGIFQIHGLISSQVIHPSRVGPEYEKRADELFEQYLEERGAMEEVRAKEARAQVAEQTKQQMREKGLGVYAPVSIDPCLRPLCDGKEKLSRPQVLSSIWKYIKENKLQDEKDGRIVKVDQGLRNGLQIYDKTTIDCFHISRYALKLCKKT